MRRLMTLAAVLLLATSCASSSPQARLRNDVAAVTDKANSKDAAGLRNAVDDLLSTIAAQRTSGDLTAAQASRLTTTAKQVRDDADLLAASASPSPSPSRSRTPSPTPTRSRTPSPTPTPTRTPSATPTASPSSSSASASATASTSGTAEGRPRKGGESKGGHGGPGKGGSA